MLPTSWTDLLIRNLSRTQKNNRFSLPRTCLIGVGNDLRGDDSVGLMVARTLLSHLQTTDSPAHLLVVEGGPAPENVTGRLRTFHPEIVILIDAAHMDEIPGTVQWIPLDSIDGMSASSHSLPLSMLASYLASEMGCDVFVLGIQPMHNAVDTVLSAPVRFAMDEIVKEMTRIFLNVSMG
ncbi:MAG: hydrogenase 3 maturation endopeptidase HyCI [Anaerolineales bacterium]|uniref:hydrogenase 3 maturation endopeptidase HyCI n=1 Tax=Candidatus Villigracilis vicinus TaxID=3140679 RepID=UPI0031365623|nr:hydrogenase 3 maturation endopeptidase HyCI [Anaerolineales bacterium]